MEESNNSVNEPMSIYKTIYAVDMTDERYKYKRLFIKVPIGVPYDLSYDKEDSIVVVLSPSVEVRIEREVLNGEVERYL